MLIGKKCIQPNWRKCRSLLKKTMRKKSNNWKYPKYKLSNLYRQTGVKSYLILNLYLSKQAQAMLAATTFAFHCHICDWFNCRFSPKNMKLEFIPLRAFFVLLTVLQYSNRNNKICIIKNWPTYRIPLKKIMRKRKQY